MQNAQYLLAQILFGLALVRKANFSHLTANRSWGHFPTTSRCGQSGLISDSEKLADRNSGSLEFLSRKLWSWKSLRIITLQSWIRGVKLPGLNLQRLSWIQGLILKKIRQSKRISHSLICNYRVCGLVWNMKFLENRTGNLWSILGLSTITNTSLVNQFMKRVILERKREKWTKCVLRLSDHVSWMTKLTKFLAILIW